MHVTIPMPICRNQCSSIPEDADNKTKVAISMAIALAFCFVSCKCSAMAKWFLFLSESFPIVLACYSPNYCIMHIHEAPQRWLALDSGCQLYGAQICSNEKFSFLFIPIPVLFFFFFCNTAATRHHMAELSN